MLFGISLIYGLTGTFSFDELSALMQQGVIYNLAFIMFLATFAFKLSVVPFHFWTADVYEGAPVPVTSFLSVISKGAVAFVFMNMLYRVFLPMQDTWYHVLVILAMLTMITGNLFALRQQNMKRFLAFSSVAQVGFILAGVSGGPSTGISSVIFFIIVYIFSNLAAFAVVDAVAAQTDKENIEDYKGFYKTNPFLGWIMAIALFSLAGIPPTAGFFGKFFLLSSAAGSGNYWFLTFAAFNMVISLYYYLRVIRSVFIDQSEQPLPMISLSPSVKAAMIICAVAAVVLGFMSWLFNHILQLTY
jgi:NADH-quinone oxidoreductase subunit N